MKRKEPKQLSLGKAFHISIQEEWKSAARHGQPHPEHSIKKKCGSNGRIDVYVDGLGDMVSVVEIKNTDWDRIGATHAKSYAQSQARQIWSYVEVELHQKTRDVCPGVIYNRLPKSIAIRDIVEKVMNEQGIQVVWHKEPIEARRARSRS